MTFYDNRAEQVASSIKKKILSQELTDPLPPSRVWCRELEVGRPTLLNALKILEHAGLVKLTARGARIMPRSKPKRTKVAEIPPDPKPTRPVDTRTLKARFLYYGRNYKELQQSSKWFPVLSWTLQRHGIRLVLERCNAIRLKAIASHPSHPDELCFLHSLPAPYQRLFMRHKRPAIIVGYAGKDVPLPYVTPDLGSSTRHAALRLLRRGFKRIVLINLAPREEGVAKSIERFKAACAEWTHQPVHAEVLRVWNDLEAQRAAIKKLAARTKEPCGFIVFSPISPGLVATALLQRGVSIPDQAEIVAIEHCQDEISFSVPVTLYEFPSQRFAKAILTICQRYFENGILPAGGKIVDLDAPKEI